MIGNNSNPIVEKRIALYIFIKDSEGRAMNKESGRLS
jgi:hypothetical protein